MNHLYMLRHEASRNFYRRGVDAQYHSSEEIGTSFAGKTCAQSSQKSDALGKPQKKRKGSQQ